MRKLIPLAPLFLSACSGSLRPDDDAWYVLLCFVAIGFIAWWLKDKDD